MYEKKSVTYVIIKQIPNIVSQMVYFVVKQFTWCDFQCHFGGAQCVEQPQGHGTHAGPEASVGRVRQLQDFAQSYQCGHQKYGK